MDNQDIIDEIDNKENIDESTTDVFIKNEVNEVIPEEPKINPILLKYKLLSIYSKIAIWFGGVLAIVLLVLFMLNFGKYQY